MAYYETLEIDDEEYYVSFEVRERCVKQGTFSCLAVDPEEYYGIFTKELSYINWIEDVEGEPVEDDDLWFKVQDELQKLIMEWD